MKKTKQKDNDTEFKSSLKQLAATTTVHGIPKIVTSKFVYQKVLWTLLFLLTFGYLIFQLSQLTSDYLSRPIKTKVSLQFESLRFPAITICNMNPVKKSMLPIASIPIRNILDPTSIKQLSDSGKKAKRRKRDTGNAAAATTTGAYGGSGKSDGATSGSHYDDYPGTTDDNSNYPDSGSHGDNYPAGDRYPSGAKDSNSSADTDGCIDTGSCIYCRNDSSHGDHSANSGSSDGTPTPSIKTTRSPTDGNFPKPTTSPKDGNISKTTISTKYGNFSSTKPTVPSAVNLTFTNIWDLLAYEFNQTHISKLKNDSTHSDNTASGKNAGYSKNVNGRSKDQWQARIEAFKRQYSREPKYVEF